MRKLSIIIILSITLLVSCSKDTDCYSTNKQIYKSKVGVEWKENTSYEKEYNVLLLRNYIIDSLKTQPCI